VTGLGVFLEYVQATKFSDFSVVTSIYIASQIHILRMHCFAESGS